MTPRRFGAPGAIAVVSILAGLAAGGSGAAAAASGSRQTASFKFTAERPGRPSGLRTKIDYVNPDDPGAKPPAVRLVVEKLARGGRFDTSAPPLCTASDAELMALGSSACASGSKIGDGTITIDTGVPGPARIVNDDVTFLNNTSQDIFLNTVHGTSARVVVRSDVTKRIRTTVASFLPGTPPDGGAIDTVDARDLRVTTGAGANRRSYVTTPPRCPRRGFWTNRVSFTYYDGVTQTVKSRSRCRARA